MNYEIGARVICTVDTSTAESGPSADALVEIPGTVVGPGRGDYLLVDFDDGRQREVLAKWLRPYLIRRQYDVSSRNGYYAIDEYLDGNQTRTITTHLTNKQANEIVAAIHDAINYFITDNQLEDA